MFFVLKYCSKINVKFPFSSNNKEPLTALGNRNDQAPVFSGVRSS